MGAQLNRIHLAILSKQQDLLSFRLRRTCVKHSKASAAAGGRGPTGAPRLAPATAASSRSRLCKTNVEEKLHSEAQHRKGVHPAKAGRAQPGGKTSARSAVPPLSPLGV